MSTESSPVPFLQFVWEAFKMTDRMAQWFLLSIIRLSELQASAICITTSLTELAFNSIHLILCALPISDCRISLK